LRSGVTGTEGACADALRAAGFFPPFAAGAGFVFGGAGRDFFSAARREVVAGFGMLGALRR